MKDIATAAHGGLGGEDHGLADEEVLGEAMTLAWQKAMRTPPPRKKARPRT